MAGITRRTALGMFGALGASRLIGCTDAAVPTIDAVPELQGFTWPPSVRAGDAVQLYVSTTARWFTVELYRFDGVRVALDIGRLDGAAVARGDHATAWAWPSYALQLPAELAAGVYIAVLRRCDRDGVPIDALPDLATTSGEARVLVVVRGDPDRPARVLYKLPLFTYHAYNTSGGGCLYGVWDRVAITLRRPGGGTGHTETRGVRAVFPDGLDDPYGDATARQWNTFATWDAKLLAWLAANGYAVDPCTDWDLHVDADLLAPYRMLVSAGHDEYWSATMRDRVEAFVAGGGNVAWFGGNTCFWSVDVDVEAASVACNKIANSAGHWDAQLDAMQRPRFENRMTGLCMVAGGYTSTPRAELGYTALAPDLWPLRGAAASFGDEEHLIGYEVDGAPIDDALALTYERDTPSSFHALAIARLPAGDPSADGWYTPASPRPGAAMIGLYADVGTVFNAGTTDWPRVLAEGEPSVARITANVLDRLATRSIDRRLVANLGAVRAAAGYFAGDGTHRIVVAVDDTVRELVWPDGGEPTATTVATVADVRAIAVSGEGRAIVTTAHDTLELAWQPDAAPRVLGAPCIALAAVTAQRAIAASATGLAELAWTPSAVTTTALAELADVTSVAAITDADGTRHAIAGDASGRVHDVAWSDSAAATTRVLVELGRPIIALAACGAGDERFAIVAVADGNVYELAWRDGEPVIRDVLPFCGTAIGTRPHASTVRGVATYVDAAAMRHATLVAAGVVHHLRWRP